MTTNHGEFLLAPADPMTGPGRDLIRDYVREILTRFNGRAPTTAEMDSAVKHDPDDTMAPPAGLFLVASLGDVPIGCGGMRPLGQRVGEIKRLYVHPSARGRRLGTTLLSALEAHARSRGLSSVRLDTRHELDEARRLYERHGYRSIARYNQSALADLWYEKTFPSQRDGMSERSGGGPCAG